MRANMAGARHARHDGFSLVELSIVLVILGLLVGGILGGQALIKAAEVRGTLSDVNESVVAFNAFKLRYMCVPGDCKYARKFFMGDVYNGDGNGLINCGIAAGGTCDAPIPEHVMAIRELQLAGLIRGGDEPGVNAVSTKLRGCKLQYYKSSLYEGKEVNYLRIFTPLGVSPWNGDCMTPEEGYNIDTKLDDSNPSQGRVLGIRFSGNPQTACVSGNHWDPPEDDAQYMVQEDGVDCSLFVHF